MLGDVTDHGGRVISGSSKIKFSGLPIARKSDRVSCPTHGENAILGGDDAFAIEGQPVALEGQTTACGSKLIASQRMFDKEESDHQHRLLWPLVGYTEDPMGPTYVYVQMPDGTSLELPAGFGTAPPDNIPVQGTFNRLQVGNGQVKPVSE
ncbi:MAG: PAAR domain-containing protein [Paraburkholderia sp.]